MSKNNRVKSTAVLVEPNVVIDGFIRFAISVNPHYMKLVDKESDIWKDTLASIVKKSRDPKEMDIIIKHIAQYKKDIVAAFTDNSVESDPEKNYESLEFLGDKVGAVVFIEYAEHWLDVRRIDERVGTDLVAYYMSNQPTSGMIQGKAVFNNKHLWSLVSYKPDADKREFELDVAGDVFEAILGLMYVIYRHDTDMSYYTLESLYNAENIGATLKDFIKGDYGKNYLVLLKEVLQDRLRIRYDFVQSKGPYGDDSNVMNLTFLDSGFLLDTPGGAEAVQEFLKNVGVTEITNDMDEDVARHLAAKNAYDWLIKNPVFASFSKQASLRGTAQLEMQKEMAEDVQRYNKLILKLNPDLYITRFNRVARNQEYNIVLYLRDGSEITIVKENTRAATNELKEVLKLLYNEEINRKAKSKKTAGPAPDQ